MSGVTSSVGVFSGIDSGKIIDQLIKSQSRPKTLLQQRVVSLQTQSTAFLDINSRLSSLKSTLSAFTSQNVFSASNATSSNTDTLTATAGNGAAVGSYSFTVDRLVTTQQALSRGFADKNFSGLGATTITVESADARVTRDNRLADLNGGNGVVRGKIQITDSAGTRAVVDLSRSETIQEVAKAIRDATDGRVAVALNPDGLALTDQAGGTGTLSVQDAQGTSGTAASLGISGSASESGDGGVLIGRSIYALGPRSALRGLNDGRGVFISSAGGTSSPDFTITARDGTAISIDIGDVYENVTPSGGGTPVLTKTKSAVTDIEGVIQRINEQAAGKITAAIAPDGRSLRLTDTSGGSGAISVAEVGTGSTARDLGLLGSASGATLSGKLLVGGIGTTLLSGIRGGRGLTGTDLTVSTRDGFTTSFNVTRDSTVEDLVSSITAAGNGRFKAELDSTATRVVLTDTSAGSGSLSISGAVADSLGLATSASSARSVTGSRLERQYIGPSTLLSSLNSGKGIGTGQIAITDSYGFKQTISISDSLQTVADLNALINSRFTNLRAQVNTSGNGLELVELAKPEGAGSSKIKVEDSSGGVAKALNLLGEASGTGAANKIDGSFRRTVTLAATDTLQQVADKITNSNAGVIGTVVDDQASSRPYRLSLTSRASGEAGRFIVDAGTFDLGLTTLSEGNNARVFYGSGDPAKALLLSSTTNAVAGVVPGLTLDIKAADSNPVTVSVTRDSGALEKALDEFVTSFNSVVARIDTVTTYNADTNKGGPLVGDSTVRSLRQELNTVVTSRAQGLTGRYQYLAQIGITINGDGNLTINKDRLRDALRTDSQAVQDVLNARTQAANSTQREISPGVFVNENTSGSVTARGLLQQLQDSIDKYIKPVDGVITRRNVTITAQVKSNNDRIARLDIQLSSKRDVLVRQFTAMEEAIGKLQSQGSAISGIRAVS